MAEAAVAVVDVGSSTFKVGLVGGATDGWTFKRAQTWRDGPPYRHLNTDQAWTWLVEGLAEAARVGPVDAVVPCTHGSAMALLREDDELALPVMAYDAAPPEPVIDAYAQMAPGFDEVRAPTNPLALTLARQLLWQELDYPDAWQQVARAVPYPQYWALRLTGVAACEVTSLGAQTHLWSPEAARPSTLALRRGWSRLLAPIRRAYDVLGPIDPAVARATGLDPATPVLTGIHDSNANYLRYLAQPTRDWTLLSTGTWLITFNPAGSVDALEAARDTCTNTDVFGQPVPCSRFMIGREFERVAGPEGMAAAATPADVTAVIGKGAMALPSFTDMGGPVPGSSGSGRLIGADDLAAGERRALALLYVALMTDLALDAVGAADRLIVDGPLAQEPLFGPLLAAVRQASVELSTVADGTIAGAALLASLAEREPVPAPVLRRALPLAPQGLATYAQDWTAAAL